MVKTGVFMFMDWNNGGKIDGEDIFLTDTLLGDDDTDKQGGGDSGGGCLATFVLLLLPPIVGTVALLSTIGVA